MKGRRSRGVRIATDLCRIADSISVTEDQQKINTFSKLNTRIRGFEEKLETLKVRDSSEYYAIH
jgi:hypothetical protein